MSVDNVRTLYSYTEWANERIIEALRGVTEEQFTRTIVSSFPSLRDTLAHIVMAEWVWLRRWKGESPTAPPAWTEAAPSLQTIVENLRAIEAERRALLDSLTEDQLRRDIAYRSMSGDPFTTRLDHQLAHVANHSTYHRGQITTMMRQIGVTPPSTDMIFYIRNRQ